MLEILRAGARAHRGVPGVPADLGAPPRLRPHAAPSAASTSPTTSPTSTASTPTARSCPFTDPALAGLERTLAARAFATLPERWQAVLWHLEVEGDTPGRHRPAVRADRQRRLRARATGPARGCGRPTCRNTSRPGSGRWDRRHRETGEKLGAYTRGGLARREAQRVEAHLAECGECRALADELREVNSGMIRSVVAPLVLGAGLVGYLASRGSTGPLAFDASTASSPSPGAARWACSGRSPGSPARPARRRTGSVSPAPSASRAWWASPRSSSATSSSHPRRRRRPRPGSLCRPWRCSRRGCPGCLRWSRRLRCSRRRSPSIPPWPCPTSPAPAAGSRGAPGAPRAASRRRCPRERCRRERDAPPRGRRRTGPRRAPRGPPRPVRSGVGGRAGRGVRGAPRHRGAGGPRSGAQPPGGRAGLCRDDAPAGAGIRGPGLPDRPCGAGARH